MNRHPANNGRALLSAWVDPVLRDHAREAAREAGVEFSAFVAEAVRREVLRRSTARAFALAVARGECSECRQIRCACVPA